MVVKDMDDREGFLKAFPDYNFISDENDIILDGT